MKKSFLNCAARNLTQRNFTVSSVKKHNFSLKSTQKENSALLARTSKASRGRTTRCAELNFSIPPVVDSWLMWEKWNYIFYRLEFLVIVSSLESSFIIQIRASNVAPNHHPKSQRQKLLIWMSNMIELRAHFVKLSVIELWIQNRKKCYPHIFEIQDKVETQQKKSKARHRIILLTT